MNPNDTKTGLRRTPNSGGSITRGGVTTQYEGSDYNPEAARGQNQGGSVVKDGAITNYAPSAYNGPAQPTKTGLQRPSPQTIPGQTQPNAGGTITRNGATTNYPATPYQKPLPVVAPRSPFSPSAAMEQAARPTGAIQAAPSPAMGAAARPSPVAPQQQTEAASPLSGDETTQPEGTSAPVPNPGQAMGFSQRGTNVPKGMDAMAGHVGGSGLHSRRFTSKESAGAYDGFIRRLFSGGAQV